MHVRSRYVGARSTSNLCKSFLGNVTYARSEISRTQGLFLPYTIEPIRKTRSREREQINNKGMVVSFQYSFCICILFVSTIKNKVASR